MSTISGKHTSGFRILAINFHYVRPLDSRYPGLHQRSPEDFSSQLDTLDGLGAFVSPQQLEDMLHNPSDSHPNNAFVLTFDDGLKDHYNHVAAELDRRDWKAFFFVNSAPWQGELLGVHRLQLLNASVPFPKLYAAFIDWLKKEDLDLDPRNLEVERVRRVYTYDEDEVARFKFAINFEMAAETKEQVLQMLFAQFLGNDAGHATDLYLSPAECSKLAEMGHTIGCHSHRHRPLSLLTPEDCATEVSVNAKSIEEATGQKPSWISFPNGVLDSEDTVALTACREQGIGYGFTMKRGFIEPGANPISLNRVDTNDAPGGKSPIINW